MRCLSETKRMRKICQNLSVTFSSSTIREEDKGSHEMKLYLSILAKFFELYLLQYLSSSLIFRYLVEMAIRDDVRGADFSLRYRRIVFAAVGSLSSPLKREGS